MPSAYSLTIHPFKTTELVTSCQFSSRKTSHKVHWEHFWAVLIELTLSSSVSSWIKPCFAVSVMHLHCFKACAGHLEGGRWRALMCSSFLQMKTGKAIWFPMIHSPGSFWSVLAVPKFVGICWRVQGDKCRTGILWTIVSWNCFVHVPGMAKSWFMFLILTLNKLKIHYCLTLAVLITIFSLTICRIRGSLWVKLCCYSPGFYCHMGTQRMDHWKKSVFFLTQKIASFQVFGCLLMTWKFRKSCMKIVYLYKTVI